MRTAHTHTHTTRKCRKKMIFHELCSNVHFSLAISDEDDIKSGSIRTIKEICCASCLKSVECMLQNAVQRENEQTTKTTHSVCAFSCSYFTSRSPPSPRFFASDLIRCYVFAQTRDKVRQYTHTHNQDSNNVYHV